jgi:hypothetical protein
MDSSLFFLPWEEFAYILGDAIWYTAAKSGAQGHTCLFNAQINLGLNAPKDRKSRVAYDYECIGIVFGEWQQVEQG